MTDQYSFNEFDLQLIDGFYSLKSFQPFKKSFPKYTNNLIWNYLISKYKVKDFSNQCVWIFFINEEKEIKGYYQMNFQIFHSATATEVMRLILMMDVKKVVFALNYSQKVNLFDVPPRVVRFYKKKLLPFEINIIDALVVNKNNYESLVTNELL
ncbi:hypothetical protein [Polaribacter cellanae]|uniref:Uncharacterized protein n=1 Tax=Polaribacter cellanae TaxID=2818493 RepID=A0A975CJM6_9FLAO|nr:hypothetical protein [Polaribacter cellanae]QTE21111.1 hypothetical protein J3359_09635 [Polaribacter cellanae]